MCTKRESQVGEAVDDGACTDSDEAFSSAGLVGVADALDAGEVRSLDVSHGIANERALPWLGVEGINCLGDQVRTGLEERGVVVGPRDDEADPVGEAVAGKVGVDSGGSVVADDRDGPA